MVRLRCGINRQRQARDEDLAEVRGTRHQRLEVITGTSMQ